MSKSKSHQYGEWRIGGSDIALNGILKDQGNNSCLLNLYSDEPLEIPYYVNVIYGKTYEGKAFTLYKCHIGGSTSTSIVHDFQKKYIYEISCDYILEGINLTDVKDVLLEEVTFSITNLNKWAFQNAVNIDLDGNSGYIITTKNIDDIVHKNDQFELSIMYTTMPDYNYYFNNSLKVSTSVDLNIKFYKPTDVVSAHIIINQVRAFLSLCTTLPTYIEYISAIPFYSESQEPRRGIRLYGQAFEFEKREEIKNNRISDEAIELEQIKEDFNLCMNNWFSKSKKLEPVIDLYLTINYHRTSLERHFLNLVQALEAYHRLTKINHVLPKKEHTARIQSIVSSLPEEHQKWVKDSLAFSNEPRLHDRMEELLTPAVKTKSPDFEAKYYHLFRLPNKEKIDIIRDIKNTRNYNTHFDEKLLRKSLKGEELFQLVLLLKAMIEFYLLTELEIDEEIVLNSTWDKVNRIDTRNSIIEATRSSNVSMW